MSEKVAGFCIYNRQTDSRKCHIRMGREVLSSN